MAALKLSNKNKNFIIILWIVFLGVLIMFGIRFINFKSNNEKIIGLIMIIMGIVLVFITKKYWWDEYFKKGEGF